MRAFLILAALLAAAPLASPGARAETPLPNLPAPDLPDNARVTDYLRAAQGAIAINNLGKAESALEMAQTRLLDRSVPLGQTGVPSNNRLNAQISEARQALSTKDRQTSLQIIASVLATASSQGL